MFNNILMAHTIVAQATATGLSGLSIIRVSGENAFQISDKCFQGKKKIVDAKSHTILYGNFVYNGEIIDDVTVSIFKSPNSYTGENVVEFGTHGGNVIPTKIIQTLMKAGCKHSEPGEFTRRAFINGKINLVQAEAIADIIHSISIPSALISAKQLRGGITTKLTNLRNQLITVASKLELELDFADEEIELINSKDLMFYLENAIFACKQISNSFKTSTILREGYFVSIIGKPNTGKSTLFNNLLQKERAIVSNIAGTTRDYLSEQMLLNDIPIKLIDTAGLRETDDLLEIEGIQFAQKMLEQSNLILLLNDFTLGENHSKTLFSNIISKYSHCDFIILQNKCDLVDFTNISIPKNEMEIPTFYISAKNPANLEALTNSEELNIINLEKLKSAISDLAQKHTVNSNDILLNERQYFKLLETENALETAKNLLLDDVPIEIISIEIRNAGRLLGELTGETWNEEVLTSIFSRFCIGK